jgi:hypothetical protein
MMEGMGEKLFVVGSEGMVDVVAERRGLMTRLLSH